MRKILLAMLAVVTLTLTGCATRIVNLDNDAICQIRTFEDYIATRNRVPINYENLYNIRDNTTNAVVFRNVIDPAFYNGKNGRHVIFLVRNSTNQKFAVVEINLSQSNFYVDFGMGLDENSAKEITGQYPTNPTALEE